MTTMNVIDKNSLLLIFNIDDKSISSVSKKRETAHEKSQGVTKRAGQVE